MRICWKCKNTSFETEITRHMGAIIKVELVCTKCGARQTFRVSTEEWRFRR